MRDGSTPANVIVEEHGVWRKRNCPGFSLALQKLMVMDGKYVDELTLWSEDEVRVVYFDVSDLFGKEFEASGRTPRSSGHEPANGH
jgi:hypothetical protein